MCDDLIKKYSTFKDLYDNVRYTIMKVDIIRFIILHKYGGLYVDLDIMPKIKRLKNDELIFAYKKGNKGKHFEMEVLQSNKGNPILLDYLQYEKTNKIKI